MTPITAEGGAAVTIIGAATVGICEDDDELRGIVRGALEREGLTTVVTATATDAVRAFARRRPDALVLDIGLPDGDGRDLCQALRARGIDAPVLFLTARDAISDRLSGFHAGGDDYLTKPFAIAELVVRVQALLRRMAPAPIAGVVALQLDPARHALVAAGGEIALTPTEFRLLAALAARPGVVLRRGQLIAAAWPDGAIVADNTLDAYLARVRRKLRDAGAKVQITTARGVGYRLAAGDGR